MTFLSGFAEGYINERNRRLEEQSRKDEIKFRYKMDYLTSQRELRTKKKQEEQDLYKKASSLAQQLGDPDSTQTFFQELKNGMDYETGQKRIAEGAYVRNPNYQKPAQTIKVPKAVSQTVSYDMEGTDGPEWQKINSDIDAIDPTLRTATIEDDNEFSTVGGEGEVTSPYMFKPQNVYKIGAYKDAVYKYEKAKQSGDPVALREAELEIKVHQRVFNDEALAKARIEGKDARYYVTLDENGKMTSGLVGRKEVVNGETLLINISNPEENDPHNELGGSIVTQRVVELPEHGQKRLDDLTDKFTTRVQKYDAGSGSFVTAMDTATKITKLLDADPNAATFSGRGLNLINKIGEEFRAGYEIILGKDQQIQAAIESGNTEGIEAMVSEYQQEVQKFTSGLLSKENRTTGENAAILQSLKIAAAYQFAVAQGVTTGKMSNQDFQNNYEQIAAAGTPTDIINGLRSTAAGAFTRLRATEAALNKSPDVKMFETQYGFKTGLKATRIGDLIMSGEFDPEQKRILMTYLSSLEGNQKAGEQEAAASASAPPPTEEFQFQNTDQYDLEGASEVLKSDPSEENKKNFDAIFGPGASERVLGTVVRR